MTNNINLTYLINTSLFLFCLLPIALISGPFLSDLIVSIISLIFLYITIRYNQYKYYNNIFFKLFLFYYFFLVLNSFFAEEPFVSLKVTIFYLRFGIFSLAVWYLIEQRKEKIIYFFYILIFTILILFFDSLSEFFLQKNILSFNNNVSSRVSSLFKDELIMGSHAVKMFPILMIGFVMFFYRIKIKFLNYCFMIIIFSLVILSGERASIFNFCFFTLIIILINPIFYKKKFFVISILSATLIIFFISSKELQYRYLVEPLQQANIIQTNEIKSKFPTYKSTVKNYKFNHSKKYFFSKEHEAHAITAIKIFQDNIIFGSGVKMFRYECKKEKYRKDLDDGCSTHPHNILLQILSETGMFGFAFYLICLFAIFFHIKKYFFGNVNFEYKTVGSYVLGFYLVIMWPLIPSGNFFGNYNSIYIYLPLGFYLYFFNNKNLQKN